LVADSDETLVVVIAGGIVNRADGVTSTEILDSQQVVLLRSAARL
jgi:hypothetical protein